MKKTSFESALKQLEKIVSDMESGALSLDMSLKKFEEGMRLSRFCQKRLEEVQHKVTLVTQDEHGGVVETPFTPEPENDD